MFILYLKRFTILLTAFLFLIMVGCEEDSTNEPSNKPTIVSFTVEPSTIPAGGDSVTLSWVVSGATSLSITPNVGAVTPTDSGSVTVFVSAATAFTLTATNSDGNTTSNVTVSAALTITVNGYVKDIYGEPVSGVTVMIKGKTPTTTDASGGFNVSNVTTPYEVRVIMSTNKIAVVYQGLTRSDPTLTYSGTVGIYKFATISGTVPPAVGKVTKVFFVSGAKVWYVEANQSSGAYTITADWTGTTNSFTGKLQVLRWTTNTSFGIPLEYDAYGYEDNLTISEGGNFSNHNFNASDLTIPVEQNISGTIVRPSSSYNLFSKTLSLNFGSGLLYLGGESGASLADNFNYKVPSITGATFGVDVYAENSTSITTRYTGFHKRGIAGGSSGTTITLYSSPQLNLPAHNGSGIDTTSQFLWTKGSGMGVCYIIISSNSGNGPEFQILTTANTTLIPNLAPQGLGLPPSESYTWYVRQYFPISSTDEAASSSFRQLTGGYIDGGIADSEDFVFTTKP